MTDTKASPPRDPETAFGNDGYRAINVARLEHLAAVLAAMRLDVRGMSVIELGAGIGDHSRFWLDRGAKLTITEGREDNLAVLRSRYPNADIRRYDLDADPVPEGRWDIAYCYGLLYHLADPARGVAALGALTGRFAFIETCVSFGDALDDGLMEEDRADPTQSLHGGACRPTRPWVHAELKKAFAHVYQPATQPDHPQFPLNWRREPTRPGLTRATFVATRAPLDVASLFERVLPRQVRHRAVARPAQKGLARVLAALGVAAVLDVGANLGQFGRKLRAGGFAGPIVSFEPLREAFAGLARAAAQDAAWQVREHALGETEEEAVMHVSANLYSSSLLEAEARTIAAEPQVTPILRRRVPVRRLDRLWDELPAAARTAPVLLKIDTQGFERAVLAGAAGVIERIDAVLLECSLVPVYQGEMLLADALATMRGLGFHPVWIEPGWSDAASGQTYQCDVLFSRSPDVPRLTPPERVASAP